MQQATTDFATFFSTLGKRLCGMLTSHVDDLLIAGTTEFCRDFRCELEKQLQVKPTATPPMTHVGFNVHAKPYSLDQTDYICTLPIFPLQATYSDYRSPRARLAWVTHSRPDICAAVAIAAQITQGTFSRTAIRTLNKIVKHLKSTADLRMRFPKLDANTVQIVAYADSSFGNLADHGTQIGYICCITDHTSTACILDYRSLKARRVVLSSTTGETISLVETFDAAVALKHDLERMLHRSVPLLLLTDAEAVFSTITKDKSPKEKPLLIDIRAMREAYRTKVHPNIGLIASADNVAVGSCAAEAGEQNV
jgi:hypothetical protein